MSNVPYISKALRKDIPSDAILLSRNEVLSMHWKLIKKWQPQSDTWPYRYGIGCLAGMSGATAVSITNYYRSKLRLGTYGKVTMTIPTIVLPTVSTLAAHLGFVSNPILLAEEGCPLCLQSRAALLQVFLGVVYPIVVSPIAGFYYATSYGTYNIPPMRVKYFNEIVDLWLQLSRKYIKTKLPIVLAVNGFFATTLTYFEADSFYKLQRTIYEREETFKQSLKGWDHS